jgi:hypothetical protein
VIDSLSGCFYHSIEYLRCAAERVAPYDAREWIMIRSRHASRALVLMLALCASGLIADPPPPSLFILPEVFCFRITDIRRVADDPEGDRFTFEFEILNWTNQDAHDLYLSLNEGTGILGVVEQLPFFAGAAIDPNGRPLGPGDDDANFPPADGTSVDAKVGQINDWISELQTTTAIRYRELTGLEDMGLPPHDLLGAGDTVSACFLVPGCVIDGLGNPVVADIETVDNANPIFEVEDNVLDGFAFDVDDFDAGEMLSLNWFMTNAGGNPIGVSGQGNAFGFGTFNILRPGALGGGWPVWARIRGVPEGIGWNRGTSNNLRDMFVDQTPEGDMFEVELGSSLTGPFFDGDDNLFQAPITAEPAIIFLDGFESGTTTAWSATV